ncbi:uncharacterized protein PRCAT00002923001 [Priceomyces carsonii]|uniref:uncharacterized protein n=1 Tax=Priceomyces carsonii TaxID=28549 RepID=UPI002ED9EE27|nr:unnamed protein product [Priceomyces carsonii]
MMLRPGKDTKVLNDLFENKNSLLIPNELTYNCCRNAACKIYRLCLVNGGEATYCPGEDTWSKWNPRWRDVSGCNHALNILAFLLLLVHFAVNRYSFNNYLPDTMNGRRSD